MAKSVSVVLTVFRAVGDVTIMVTPRNVDVLMETMMNEDAASSNCVKIMLGYARAQTWVRADK
jgi:hypothetical protein